MNIYTLKVRCILTFIHTDWYILHSTDQVVAKVEYNNYIIAVLDLLSSPNNKYL